MREWIIQAETIGNISDGYWYGNGEEIVRCKDCKWWGDLDPKNRYTDCYCHVVECSTEPDWYCADGERKDDEEQV